MSDKEYRLNIFQTTNDIFIELGYDGVNPVRRRRSEAKREEPDMDALVDILYPGFANATRPHTNSIGP